ncbi:MAG: ROK family protein [Pseudonocardia sp.]|nr:ROK family protein [Pseudonocardia sp.]
MTALEPAPSPLPPLRLSVPTLSARMARVDAAAHRAVMLSTLARLVAAGTAVSKADLVPAAGLARTSVSTGVDELLARGVLRLDGVRPTPGRGRPADRLALNPRGGHVLIADLGAHGAHLAVVDLSQRVHTHTRVDVEVADGPDAVLDVIESRLEQLCASADGGAGHVPVRALVIGVPGPVDGRRGIPVRPPIMPGWHGYPVSARLSQTFGCPVLLENDVNLRALGEARALPADQAPLLYVKIGTGIGGGLITSSGVLHHGADGGAGDIGHVRVRGGPDTRCVCGNVGCIEAVASAAAIARRLTESADSAGAAGSAGFTGGAATIADVRTLVARNDPTAVGLVREAAGLIGEVVATLVHFYNPARVTIGGSLAAASDELLAGIRAVVYRRALPLATRNLVLANTVLGRYAGVAGATVLGIEEALSPDGIGDLMPG